MRDPIQEAYKQIITQELEEGKVKNAMIAIGAAGAIAGAALIGTGSTDSSGSREVSGLVQDAKKKAINYDPDKLHEIVTSKFKVDDEKARHIVNTAIKYSHPTFPQAHHILAIAGIESSFNENAVSKLKHDPAVGLMQIRPKVWNIDKKELSTIEGQIRHGAGILHHYFKKTGSPDAAVKAYNIGLTNFNRGKQQDAAHRYHTKFTKELSRYTED